MKNRWKILAVVAFVIFLFGIKEIPPEPPRVVTQLKISCDRGYCVARRVYTTAEKMQPILNHLRQRKNLGWAQTDPERLAGDTYRIEICLSDGTKYVSYQRAGAYYSRRCHAWQKTDPQQAQLFVELLRRTPSD